LPPKDPDDHARPPEDPRIVERAAQPYASVLAAQHYASVRAAQHYASVRADAALCIRAPQWVTEPACALAD